MSTWVCLVCGRIIEHSRSQPICGCTFEIRIEEDKNVIYGGTPMKWVGQSDLYVCDGYRLRFVPGIT